MACSGSVRKKRLVSSLDNETLELLSMKLNPRMLMKDYQTLGGKMKYTHEYIRNFAREVNPTLTLLHHWWSSKKGKEKTVSVLIEHLSEMERDDAVDLLRPCEFYSSHEAGEYDETLESPVVPGAWTRMNTDMNSNVEFAPRENEQNQHGDMATRPASSEGRQFERNQGASFDNNILGEMSSVSAAVVQPPFLPKPPSTLGCPTPSLSLTLNNHSPPPPTPPPPINPHLLRDPMGPLGPDMYDVEESDGWYGSRRDIQLLRAAQRPRNLDGSSACSSEYNEHFYGGAQYCSPPLQGYDRNGMMMRAGYGDRYGAGQFHGNLMTMSGLMLHGYDQNETLGSPGGHDITVAADKVALVIGNQDYAHSKLKGLQYPKQDAADVAHVLTQLQFKVVSLINLTHSEMRMAMLAFCCLLGKGVYGVVYYAGHAYEDNGENFLLPIDSDLKYKRDESLRTQEILEAMQQCKTSLNLLIIDACRVNLPNRTGTTVPRIKRGVEGNTIFAYSCCSLQESLEAPDSRNGIYCSHLLRRLSENRRIENILMDVGTDFAQTYHLSQRPCLETDCKMDFRLTDPIQPEILTEQFIERCRRWKQANRCPEEFSLEKVDIKFTLKFHAPFCNVLLVTVTTTRLTNVPIADFCLELTVKDPLCCQEQECIEYEMDDIISHQQFEITNIQKLYKLQEAMLLSIRALFRVDGKLVKYEKHLDLGWPLVSSVMCLWDNWLLGDRCRTTAV